MPVQEIRDGKVKMLFMVPFQSFRATLTGSVSINGEYRSVTSKAWCMPWGRKAAITISESRAQIVWGPIFYRWWAK